MSLAQRRAAKNAGTTAKKDAAQSNGLEQDASSKAGQRPLPKLRLDMPALADSSQNEDSQPAGNGGG